MSVLIDVHQLRSSQYLQAAAGLAFNFQLICMIAHTHNFFLFRLQEPFPDYFLIIPVPVLKVKQLFSNNQVLLLLCFFQQLLSPSRNAFASRFQNLFVLLALKDQFLQTN